MEVGGLGQVTLGRDLECREERVERRFELVVRLVILQAAGKYDKIRKKSGVGISVAPKYIFALSPSNL